MSKFIDRPRYTCALGGALIALRALPRTIPIIHASSGCGFNVSNATTAGAGYLGGGYCGGTSASSTNVVEREIVFGGEERLAEQIQTTLEIIDGDLYVVITGCMVEMIGDDISVSTNKFAAAGVPVLPIPTPSFRGTSYEGYDMLLSGLFRLYTTKGRQHRKNRVNLWGLPPGQDIFYKGNLTEFRRLLGRIGLDAYTFFGEGEPLSNLQNAADASLNIILSDTYGLKSAEVFEEVHGTPWISVPLPIGASQTANFLRTVAQALKIPDAEVEQVIAEEDARYYDYMERLADIYNDADLQRYAVITGDANYAPSVARFVSDDLGWVPRLVVITDSLEPDDTESRATLLARFEGWESDIRPEVRFDTDASAVVKYLPEAWEPNHNERYYNSLTPLVLIGSVFERDLAIKLNAPLLTLSFPATNRVILNQAYAGYNGGLTFMADLFSALLVGR
ncbi:MAG: hypothetical protein LBT32_00990 [Peptococcaceae bacterium]|jgi:nitrogenase molybdenum-iron protein beta chain|nr:hypothetical protein [Peptococcaceae bacterium]